MGKPTKKIKPLSVICFIAAIILCTEAIVLLLFGGVPAKDEREPVDVYIATEQDMPVYLKLQYMSESVAYLEAVESMQYYITFDSEWNPAVICLHDNDVERYQPYIDWLFTEATEGGPEAIQVTGYSVPFDDELKQYVIENYNFLLGMEFATEENFVDLFGEYYVTTGQNSVGFQKFNIGIYLLLGAVALVILGVAISYKTLMSVAETETINCFEVQRVHKGRGIVGAFLGALLGGILWAAIGALGYIIGWIGIAIVFFAMTGYRIFAKEESRFGTAVSVIFSLLIVLPATYFAGVWSFYQEVNESVSEYISLGRAFQEYGGYLTKTDSWGNMIYNIVIGYVCMLVAGAYSTSAMFKRKKQEEQNITGFANSTAATVWEEEKKNDEKHYL